MAEMENRTTHGLIKERKNQRQKARERTKNTYISQKPLFTVWKPFGKYAGRVRYEMFLSRLVKAG